MCVPSALCSAACTAFVVEIQAVKIAHFADNKKIKISDTQYLEIQILFKGKTKKNLKYKTTQYNGLQKVYT